MVYVTVKEQSDERLHLSREPTLRSWSILIGGSFKNRLTGTNISFRTNFPCRASK